MMSEDSCQSLLLCCVVSDRLVTSWHTLVTNPSTNFSHQDFEAYLFHRHFVEKLSLCHDSCCLPGSTQASQRRPDFFPRCQTSAKMASSRKTTHHSFPFQRWGPHHRLPFHLHKLRSLLMFSGGTMTKCRSYSRCSITNFILSTFNSMKFTHSCSRVNIILHFVHRTHPICKVAALNSSEDSDLLRVHRVRGNFRDAWLYLFVLTCSVCFINKGVTPEVQWCQMLTFILNDFIYHVVFCQGCTCCVVSTRSPDIFQDMKSVGGRFTGMIAVGFF